MKNKIQYILETNKLIKINCIAPLKKKYNLIQKVKLYFLC